MVSSTDGWIMGADGTILHYSSQAPIESTTYLIIATVVVIAVAAMWLVLRKKTSNHEKHPTMNSDHKKPHRASFILKQHTTSVNKTRVRSEIP
jgi:hypothetical protein